jgi:hypothetical protein
LFFKRCGVRNAGAPSTPIFRNMGRLRQRYIEFLQAAAKVDPTSENGNAAMSDLENFRKETRAWL